MYFELMRVTRDTPCRRCREVMHVGEWLCRSWIYIDPSTEETKTIYYHPACAVDVDAKNAAMAFAPPRASSEADWRTATPLEKKALAAVEALAERRAAAIDRLASDREKLLEGDTVEPWTIEPATDRAGRPRVRVRFGGNASSGNAYTPVFERCVPDWTLCSPKREYVLAPAAASIQNNLDDPSQPVVAALFGTRISVKIVGSQRDKVRAWRTEGLPTPLLWVIGSDPKDRKATDKKVLELREMLASTGYEADEAIAICTEDVDEAAFAALAAALDELLDRGARVEDTSNVSPVDRAIGLLGRAIEEERAEAWSTALHNARETLELATPEQTAKIASLAAKCASNAECHSEIELIVCAIKESTRETHDATVRLVAATLGDRTIKKLPARFSDVCATLERPLRDEGAKVDLAWLTLLEDALVAEKSATQRGEQLATILVRAGDAGCAARLHERAATAKPAAKREWIAATATNIAEKVAKIAKKANAKKR